jgi:hypothetical protein
MDGAMLGAIEDIDGDMDGAIAPTEDFAGVAVLAGVVLGAITNAGVLVLLHAATPAATIAAATA